MDTSNFTTRVCTKCKQEFPATREFFYGCKAGKFGLASWCKTCHRKINRDNTHVWYQDNKQHVSDYGKQYRVDHQDEIAAYNKDYYWSNIDRERERIRNNKKRFRPRIREYKREYYHQHKDVILPEKSKKRALKMQTDPEFRARIKAQTKTRKAKRRSLEIKAPGFHTAADIRQLQDTQQDLCAYCGIRLFGDSHLDHIQPLSRAGSNWPTNLCLTCADCNLSKGKKTVDEWQAVRGW